MSFPYSFVILLSGEGGTDIQAMHPDKSGNLIEMFLRYFRQASFEETADMSWMQEEISTWKTAELRKLCQIVNKAEFESFKKQSRVPVFRPSSQDRDPRVLGLKNTALRLGLLTNQKEAEFCVLFHDCDTLPLEDVAKAMRDGFSAAKCRGAIAMVPYPTSESWILAAWLNLNGKPSERINESNAVAFERSLRPNDNNPRSAKSVLARHVSKEDLKHLRREEYQEVLETIDNSDAWQSIECLPSVKLFVRSLKEAVRNVAMS